MKQPLGPDPPRYARDPSGRFDVHRMECIASVLDVQANGVDHPIGARNGGLYGALVICVGGDLFDAVALSPTRMPRGDAHRGAGLAQIAHDATANKASSLKHGYAAHWPIDPIILGDALD